MKVNNIFFLIFKFFLWSRHLAANMIWLTATLIWYKHAGSAILQLFLIPWENKSFYEQELLETSFSKAILFLNAPNYRHLLNSWAQKRKWETFAEMFWSTKYRLSFSDRTRTGEFNMIWPLARDMENLGYLSIVSSNR